MYSLHYHPKALSAASKLERMGVGYTPQTTASIPSEFSVYNYPNPANPGTSIRYALPEAGLVSIRVYNMNGQRVADLVNADMPAGRHVVRWDGQTSTGQAAATGVYFYRLQFEDRVMSRKFLLLR